MLTISSRVLHAVAPPLWQEQTYTLELQIFADSPMNSRTAIKCDPAHVMCVQTNESSQMREYHGSVFDTVMAVVNVLHGGQVVVDCNTFHGINARLVELAKAVPQSPNYELLGYRGASW